MLGGADRKVNLESMHSVKSVNEIVLRSSLFTGNRVKVISEIRKVHS